MTSYLKTALTISDTEGNELNLLSGYDILVLSPTPTYPLDQGNRRRIFAYCQYFKNLGAKIYFLFYAFEWWFRAIPQEYLNHMNSQWDSFYLIPVSIPIQQPPGAGRNFHLIDEWWDERILEPFIKWLFDRKFFDVFIVNYPFLSKALEFAPEKTFKILDMHDKFSGRRALLESLGFEPDFFYTTEEQEKIALERADLIWAIKEEEAIFFKRLTKKPVITLPHVEDLKRVKRVKHDDEEEYLILGMVGAKNKVNIGNFRAFFQESLPFLRRTLAPVKFKLGGSVCEDVDKIFGMKIPHEVELRGRFGDPEEFYSAIDVVLLPVAQSTGLKIKAIEALSYGQPIIAHRHAMEGIPTSHPFHRCNNFREMAEAITELAFNPHLSLELRRASIESYMKLYEITKRGYFRTIFHIKRALLNIVIPVNIKKFFNNKGFYFYHLRESLFFLKNFGKLYLFSEDLVEYDFYDWAEFFHHLPLEIEILISQKTSDRGHSVTHSLSRSYRMVTISEFVEQNPQTIFWFADIPREITERSLINSNPRGFIRIDLLTNLLGYSPEVVQSVFGTYSGLKGIGNLLPGMDPLSAVLPSYFSVPFWKECNLWMLSDKADPKGIWIVATPDWLDLIVSFWEVLHRDIGFLRIVLPKRENIVLARNKLVPIEESRILSLEEIYEDLTKINPPPALVLEISDKPWLFSIIKETLQRRCGTLWISLFTSLPSDRRTLEEVLEMVLHAPWHYERLKYIERATYANDAGYTYLWRELSNIKNLLLVKFNHLLEESP